MKIKHPVDIDGILNILPDPVLNEENGKMEIPCMRCNFIERFNFGTTCPGCVFRPAHKTHADGKNGIECSAKLKKFGILEDVGKLHLFLFLNNPELNWRFPPIHIHDLGDRWLEGFAPLGEEKNERKLAWGVHHIKERFNDGPEYQVLVLNTEHPHLHRDNANSELLESAIERLINIKRRILNEGEE